LRNYQVLIGLAGLLGREKRNAHPRKQCEAPRNRPLQRRAASRPIVRRKIAIGDLRSHGLCANF